MDTTELSLLVALVIMTAFLVILDLIQVFFANAQRKAQKNITKEDEKISSLQQQLQHMREVVPETITEDIVEKKRSGMPKQSITDQLQQQRLDLERQKFEAQKRRDDWAKIIAAKNFIQWLADRREDEDDE